MHKNNDRYNSHTAKIGILENQYVYINQTLLRIEKRLDKIDEKFDKLEQKTEEKFDKLEQKIDSNFKENKSDLVRLESKVDSNFIHLTEKIDSHFKWLLATIVLTVSGFVITTCMVYLSKAFNWIT